MYDVADPPDLVAPVSPSAERTAAMEKDLWRVEGLTRASLVICVRSIIAFGRFIICFERLEVFVCAGDDSFSLSGLIKLERRLRRAMRSIASSGTLAWVQVDISWKVDLTLKYQNQPYPYVNPKQLTCHVGEQECYSVFTSRDIVHR
jgi:hypothetical protein